MFLHILKYKLIQLFHDKELVGWTFAFPIILGTFFYLSFGNLINNSEFNFSPIPIALVTEADANTSFESVLDNLSQDNEDQLFTITKTNKDDALKLLKEDKIDGIIYSTETPTVTVSKSGLNQSIIKSFTEQYLQHASMYQKIATDHPEKLAGALSLMTKEIRYNKEISFSNTNMDTLSQYFYALIAMTCLFGSTIGSQCVENIQANLSALGARRSISPAHKLTVIVADFCGSVIMNYGSVLLLFFYLTAVLKVNFGSKIGFILITALAGSVIGVSMGTFIGAFSKIAPRVKDAIIMIVTMGFSFLSGLMVNTMKNIVEHHFPIINRINPAALITDCFYSLNMYDTYTRFYKDIAIMGVMAVLLCYGSYLLLRRTKYASI